MSLRWREERGVALAPATAKWARWARGWSRTPAEQTALPVAVGVSGSAWKAPLAALQSAWTEVSDKPGRPADVRVLLSNHFVRYAIVPWHDQLTRPAERQALAEHAFRAAFGERAAGWRVQLAPTGYGEPALACAVDRDLVTALATLCEAGSHHLVALQPLLMAAFNQHRRQLGRDACLSIIEPGRLCCAWLHEGRWRAVRNLRLGGISVDDLFERERQVLGVPTEASLHVCDLRDGLLAPGEEPGGGPMGPMAVWRTDETTPIAGRVRPWEALRHMRMGSVVVEALLERERQLLGVPTSVPGFVCDVGHGLPTASRRSAYRRLAPPAAWRADRPLALFAGGP